MISKSGQMLFLVANAKKWLAWRLIQLKFRKAKIHRGAQVEFSSTISKYCVLFPGVDIFESSIGKYSYVQRNTVVMRTEVGPFCSIADNCSIGLNNHPTDFASTSPVFYDSMQPLPKFLFSRVDQHPPNLRSVIGADVWRGQGVRIMAGTSIGTGSVIGAGAVVTHDVAPYSIVGGIPARLIRMRFSEEICNNLLLSKWWEYDERILSELGDLFRDPQRLISAMSSLRG